MVMQIKAIIYVTVCKRSNVICRFRIYPSDVKGGKWIPPHIPNPSPPPKKKVFKTIFYLHLPFTVAVRIHPFEKMLSGEKYKRWTMRGSGKFVTRFRFFILKIIQRIIQRVNQRMLYYYNVHVSKNRAMFSSFPEHHWVASSMILCVFTRQRFQLTKSG